MRLTEDIDAQSYKALRDAALSVNIPETRKKK